MTKHINSLRNLLSVNEIALVAKTAYAAKIKVAKEKIVVKALSGDLKAFEAVMLQK